ncbi:MAG: CocE/NonD family hydrolase, partial [Bacteroidota bacterium]
MPQLGKDGKDLIDWMAQQSWCDGHVGMWGQSYLG